MTSNTTNSLHGVSRAEPQAEPNKRARFWNWFAARYATKPVPDQKAYEHKLAVTREHLHPDAVVREIGCGTGSTAIAHAPYAQRIDASDFSAKMIDIAREKALVAGVDNVNFECREASTDSGGDTHYDVVLALNVLHLLPDWQAIIENAWQQLRSGGVLITSTPCLDEAPAWLRWIMPVAAHSGCLPALVFFSSEELAAAHARAGFDLEYEWQANSKNGLFLVARKPC